MSYSLQNYGSCGCDSTTMANPKAKLGFGAFAVGIVGAWAINASLNSEGMQRTFADSARLASGQTKDERLATITAIATFYTIGVLLGSKAGSGA